MKSVSYSFWGKKFTFRTDDAFCDRIAITGIVIYIRILISFSALMKLDLSGAGSMSSAQSLCCLAGVREYGMGGGTRVT